jgi:hypothetical protein
MMMPTTMSEDDGQKTVTFFAFSLLHRIPGIAGKKNMFFLIFL